MASKESILGTDYGLKFVCDSRSRQRKATPPQEAGGERGTEKSWKPGGVIPMS